MITREFNLYLHAGHSIPLVINANQYDRGEQWLFKLFNSDGTQYVPSSGAIVGIKSDNLGIINTGSVDAQGRVVINETQQMTAAVGKAVFELVIDDGTHGTANFVVLVEEKPGNNADLSETDISMIEEAIEAASSIKPYGSPLVASAVAGMTDHDKVYVYVGSETGYTSGNWYYWDGTAWTSGGVYNSVAVQTDTTLTLSGVAADAKKTGDEISDLKSEISDIEEQIEGGTGTGMSADFKVALDSFMTAMLTLADNVAYDDDASGDDIYSDIETAKNAVHSAMYPPVNLASISAVYTQSGTVYANDSLDSLKADLAVTAHYSDSSTQTVSDTDYILTGTLAVGTSTITVSYGGKTTTFDVTVSDVPWTLEWSYADGALPSRDEWNITENGADAHTITFESGKGIKWVGRSGGYNLVPKNYQTTEYGEIEIVANFEVFSSVINVRATLSDSSCIIGFLSRDGVRINGSTYEPIADTALSAGTDYTMRVVREGNTGKVYVNDELMYSGALRELSGTNNVLISTTTTAQASSTVYIKSIKFKHIS